jgi:neurofibromin 1
MGLVTSMAFQHSPAIQSRAFIVLGTLATLDVDDDFMYQMLVAFKTALAQSSETDTTSVLSMLRCIYKVVPALSPSSKYCTQLFWLAVALLQSSHVAFYVQAADLLRQTLEVLQAHNAFRDSSVADVLLESRMHLDETLGQLDQILGLSFDTSFSFSLASIIFKGVRHSANSGLRGAAEAVLRSLLRVTVRAIQPTDGAADGSLLPDALGYFLALIPLSTSRHAYERLVRECNVSGFETDTDNAVPRISLDFIGVDDSNTALMMTSFVGAMLTTAQGDDTETQILYTLLADVGAVFPDIVAMAYVFHSV